MSRPLSVVMLCAMATLTFIWSSSLLPLAPPPRHLGEAMLGASFDVLSEPKFVVTTLLTFWLPASVIEARAADDVTRLIRLGSHVAYMRHLAMSSARSLVVPGGVVMLASLVPAVVPAVVAWQPATADAGGVTWMPLTGALAAQVVLIVVFLVVVRMLICVVGLIAGTVTAICVAIVIWIWGAPVAQWFAIAGTITDFASYVSVPSLSSLPELAASVLAVYAATVFGIFGAAVVLDRHARHRGIRLPAWMPMAAVALALLVSAAPLAGGGAPPGAATVDWLFLGPTGSVIQMMISLVVLVGYALAVHLRLSDEWGPWRDVVAFRHGSRRAHVAAILGRETGTAAAYALVVLVAAVAAHLVAGGRDLSFDTGDAALVLFQLTVVQTLQLVFYVMCVVAAMHASDSPLAGLIAVGVIAAAAALPLPAEWVIPVQRSTTAVLLSGGWGAAVANTLVLLAATAVAFVVASASRGSSHSPAPDRMGVRAA